MMRGGGWRDGSHIGMAHVASRAGVHVICPRCVACMRAMRSMDFVAFTLHRRSQGRGFESAIVNTSAELLLFANQSLGAATIILK